MGLGVFEVGENAQMLVFAAENLPFNKPGDCITAYRTALKGTPPRSVEFLMYSFLEDFSPENAGGVQSVLAVLARLWNAYCSVTEKRTILDEKGQVMLDPSSIAPILVIPKIWQPAVLQDTQFLLMAGEHYTLCPIINFKPYTVDGLHTITLGGLKKK